MNKMGQITAYAQFGASLFITIVLFLVLREPIINPMIDEAISATTDPFTKFILKIIPLVLIFFIVLIAINILRRGGR